MLRLCVTRGPPGCFSRGVILMSVLGALLLVGVILTLRWGGTPYEPWTPGPAGGGAEPGTDRLPLQTAALGYLRGVAIALVGGFWAGALVTGPTVRLIMRLLAATAGDGAQGLLTEAEEVVGNIDLGGTIGLYLFGGILPGLLSAALYLLVRRWLPAGRLGGLAFGALHLVVAATRLDPLRPDNPDFDIVGPGWLAVLTFSLAAILHGMAVVAIANRYSTRFPAPVGSRAGRVRTVLPLVLPVLLLIPGVFLVFLLTMGLVVTWSRPASLSGGRCEPARPSSRRRAGRARPRLPPGGGGRPPRRGRPRPASNVFPRPRPRPDLSRR